MGTSHFSSPLRFLKLAEIIGLVSSSLISCHSILTISDQGAVPVVEDCLWWWWPGPVTSKDERISEGLANAEPGKLFPAALWCLRFRKSRRFTICIKKHSDHPRAGVVQLRSHQGHPGRRRHRDGENQYPAPLPPPAVGQERQERRTEARVGSGRGCRRHQRDSKNYRGVERRVGAEKAQARPPAHPKQPGGKQQFHFVVTTGAFGIIKLTTLDTSRK